MKIRIKVLVTALISLVIALFCTLFIVKALLVGYIEKEEITLVSHNYDSTISMLQREEGSLQNTVLDWAQWDDTYRYINDRNSEYKQTNLQTGTLLSLKLEYMVFLDKNHNIVNTTTILNEKDSGKVLESLIKIIKSKSYFKKNTDLDPVTGLTVINGDPMFVSIAPITNNDGTAPGNGYLILVRYVQDSFIEYMEKVLQVRINFLPVNPEENLAEPQTTDLADTANNTQITQIVKSDSKIKSYMVMKDFLNDKPISVLFELDRRTYNNGLSAIFYFGLIFTIAILVVASLCIFAFDSLVTKRISRLHAFVDNIAVSKDTSTRINIEGKDEISMLASNMNNMLGKLDASYTELKERDERFRRVMEATNDGFFDINLISGILYISPFWLKHLGYTINDTVVMFQQFLSVLLPEDRNLFESTLSRYLAGELTDFRVECRAKKMNGEWLWIVIRGKLAGYDEHGTPERMVGTVSDITKRKKFEEENLYLLQSDPVTTLKNRTYMENMLKNADQCKDCNGWLIMGDVNGLKLINDSFGHQEGDELLRIIGEILKKCCEESDTPARWGGDEFLILVMNRDSAYVEKLVQKIKLACESVVRYPFKISIAMGIAQKDRNHAISNAVLKLAEERMYRNKLLESRSTRSAIIASLEQSLHEKHIETQEHTIRIKDMCLMVGQFLGMSQEELDELELLGVLHDIGKIAIPESVLLKPSSLTEDEWEIMKTHTEIGYRIAASTPELVHIAEEILSHHERYDGGGYPRGLAGNDIPKLSRLLAIVDSFDVMTHDRVYKKAISEESAVEELKVCSGKQFDPEMVEIFLKLLSEKKFNDGKTVSIA